MLGQPNTLKGIKDVKNPKFIKDLNIFKNKIKSGGCAGQMGIKGGEMGQL